MSFKVNYVNTVDRSFFLKGMPVNEFNFIIFKEGIKKNETEN